MVTQVTQTNAAGQALPRVPEWWINQRGGSDLEYYVYRAILKTGRQEGVDFVYQNRFFGGKISRGGAVVDFLIFSPEVGINVQSLYYHGTSAAQRAHDKLQRIALESSGLRVAYISEEDAINRPDEAVREAIAGTRGQSPLGE